MPALLIRGLDDTLKRQLRLRAAENGRSMEEEVRQILRHALGVPSAADVVQTPPPPEPEAVAVPPPPASVARPRPGQAIRPVVAGRSKCG